MTFNDDLPTADEASGQHAEVAPRRSRDPLAGPEADAMLRRAADLVASARPMPLSSSVMVNRDEILDLLGQAIDKLPDELRQARWLLKEREEFLARVQSEGDEILDAASAKAESMVQRTEVVKAAEQRAKRIVEAADDEARRLRHESEDFCDQRLAQFEIVLDRTMKMVHAGREKLNSTQVTGSVPAAARRRPRLGPTGGGSPPTAASAAPGAPRGAVPTARASAADARRRPGLRPGRGVRGPHRRARRRPPASSRHPAPAPPHRAGRGPRAPGHHRGRRPPRRGGQLDAMVEATGADVVVTGVVRFPWEGDCRRCLQPVTGTAEADVREIFEPTPVEAETWPLDGDSIDLGPVLREVALLSLPLVPLCSDDCAGPDPERFPATPEDDAAPGEGDPTPTSAPRDPRWAALDDLRFD